MRKNTAANLAKGAAAGVVTGAALGMAGMYLMGGDKKRLKKTVKKAEKKAREVLDGFEDMMDHRMF